MVTTAFGNIVPPAVRDPSVGGTSLPVDLINYKVLAADPDFLIFGTITRDTNGAATSAPVVWPDGSTGTYTATITSASFPGAVDAYAITYGSPTVKTYTQSAVTRDESGAVTVRPVITEA